MIQLFRGTQTDKRTLERTEEYFYLSILKGQSSTSKVAKYKRQLYLSEMVAQVSIQRGQPRKVHKKFSAGFQFFVNFVNRVWLPGGCATSGLLYPEIVQPLDILTQTLHNLRVTIPGNCPTSGYSIPEIGRKKTFFRKYLNKNKNIFENILGCDSRAQVLFTHKKQEVENLMLLSL